MNQETKELCDGCQKGMKLTPNGIWHINSRGDLEMVCTKDRYVAPTEGKKITPKEAHDLAVKNLEKYNKSWKDYREKEERDNNFEDCSPSLDENWEESHILDCLVWAGDESSAKNDVIEFIRSLLSSTRTQALHEINKEWLAINLRNDNKENWSKELEKFSLFMQALMK